MPSRKVHLLLLLFYHCNALHNMSSILNAPIEKCLEVVGYAILEDMLFTSYLASSSNIVNRLGPLQLLRCCWLEFPIYLYFRPCGVWAIDTSPDRCSRHSFLRQRVYTLIHWFPWFLSHEDATPYLSRTLWYSETPMRRPFFVLRLDSRQCMCADFLVTVD